MNFPQCTDTSFLLFYYFLILFLFNGLSNEENHRVNIKFSTFVPQFALPHNLLKLDRYDGKAGSYAFKTVNLLCYGKTTVNVVLVYI